MASLLATELVEWVAMMVAKMDDCVVVSMVEKMVASLVEMMDV